MNKIRINDRFNRIDKYVTHWMAQHGVRLLRITLGIVFFWFGFLKFFPGISAAENIAVQTIWKLSFGIITPPTGIVLLAMWECLIGLGLLAGRFLRATLLLLFLQMIGTITPLFLFPSETFATIPYAPTLEGQYIIKNIVLISAGIVIGATVRGGKVVSEFENVKQIFREEK